MKRMLHPRKFFNQEEETQIIQAIKQAELNTSGEIRVHLSKAIKQDPVKEAVRIFKALNMDKTKQRNGCLILIGLKNNKIAVIGDKGINDIVGEGFWNDAVCIMINNFKKGDFTQGVSKAVLKIGEKLKQYFPYREDDVNELSDEISKEEI